MLWHVIEIRLRGTHPYTETKSLLSCLFISQNGTLAGNISIKKQHPEFPSDVFITFEALDVQVLVHENANSSRVMSLFSYLQDSTPKLVIGGFILRPYPKERYLFNSYKVSASIIRRIKAQVLPLFSYRSFHVLRMCMPM